jgi:hypothetical protein
MSTRCTWILGACLILGCLAGGALFGRSSGAQDSPLRARKQAQPGLKIKRDLVQALQEALKTEKEQGTRLLLAEGLIRVEPRDTAAAQELVGALTSERAAEGYLAIERVIAAAPPALVEALLPVLKNPEDIHRRRAAALLAKIDPQALP